MKKWIKNITVLSFLLAVIVVGGVCTSEAAGFGHGHRSGADMKIIASLGLSSDEQTALTAALSNYGPAVKTAMQAFHAAKKQMNMDLKATTPDGSRLADDATKLATAKGQLKTARTQLNSALLAALTQPHLQQLQAQLTAQFQSRLDAKTDRLLFEYTRHLKKQ
jgi:predicted Zn-dependent protease